MKLTNLYNMVASAGESLIKLSQTAIDHMRNSELAQNFMKKASEITGLKLLGGSMANEQLMPIPVESGPDLGSPGGM